MNHLSKDIKQQINLSLVDKYRSDKIHLLIKYPKNLSLNNNPSSFLYFDDINSINRLNLTLLR